MKFKSFKIFILFIVLVTIQSCDSVKRISHKEHLLTKNNITLSYTDEAVDYIAEIGYDPQFGARPVKRVLQKNILNELSKQLLAGTVQPESDIILDQFEGKFVFRNKEAEKV